MLANHWQCSESSMQAFGVSNITAQRSNTISWRKWSPLTHPTFTMNCLALVVATHSDQDPNCPLSQPFLPLQPEWYKWFCFSSKDGLSVLCYIFRGSTDRKQAWYQIAPVRNIRLPPYHRSVSKFLVLTSSVRSPSDTSLFCYTQSRSTHIPTHQNIGAPQAPAWASCTMAKTARIYRW